MLRKYSNYRTHSDNLKLGALTAFSAGMVNVLSLIIFFAFTSNVTGFFAIFSQEISKGNWFQAAIVLLWILLFFLGSFTSNILIIHGTRLIGRYLSHAIPLILEMMCLLFVGIYLQHFYIESLQETELLVALLLFAMGLQNGLTASISNSAIKTTHLTGISTDLAILLSMFTKKKYRNDTTLTKKAQLLASIMFFYLAGGIITGLFYYRIEYATFYIVCAVLGVIIFYDLYRLSLMKYIHKRPLIIAKYYKKEKENTKNEQTLKEA